MPVYTKGQSQRALGTESHIYKICLSLCVAIDCIKKLIIKLNGKEFILFAIKIIKKPFFDAHWIQSHYKFLDRNYLFKTVNSFIKNHVPIVNKRCKKKTQLVVSWWMSSNNNIGKCIPRTFLWFMVRIEIEWSKCFRYDFDLNQLNVSIYNINSESVNKVQCFNKILYHKALLLISINAHRIIEKKK